MVSIKTKGWSLCFLIIFSSVASMTSGSAPKPASWGGSSAPQHGGNGDDVAKIIDGIIEIIDCLQKSDQDDAEAGRRISVQIYIIIGVLLSYDCNITEDGDKIRDDILTIICVLFGLKGKQTNEGNVIRREICKIIQELFLSNGGPYASYLRASILSIISVILNDKSKGTDTSFVKQKIIKIFFIIISRVGFGGILKELPALLGLLFGGGGHGDFDLSGLFGWDGGDASSYIIQIIIKYYLSGAGGGGSLDIDDLLYFLFGFLDLDGLDIDDLLDFLFDFLDGLDLDGLFDFLFGFLDFDGFDIDDLLYELDIDDLFDGFDIDGLLRGGSGGDWKTWIVSYFGGGGGGGLLGGLLDDVDISGN